MPLVLALYEDIFSNDAVLALPPRPRMIFVVHGALTIADRPASDGEAWHGEGAVTLRGGQRGRNLLALGARAGGSGRRGGRPGHDVSRKARRAPRHLAEG